MITETRLTVEFVLGLISLDPCGNDSEKFEDRTPQRERLSNQDDYDRLVDYMDAD